MTYTVKPGDTLSRIAKTLNITLEALLNANPRFRADPDRIMVGDELQIPEPNQAAEPAKEMPLGGISWMLGQLSAKYETSGRGPGTVSSGTGDAGGASYGARDRLETPLIAHDGAGRA
jgi:LysM repeat protein